MSSIGIFTDDLFLKHDTGPNHPESFQRLIAIREKLESRSYYSNFQQLTPRPATIKEIELVHGREYIHSVDNLCNRNGGFLNSDTVVSADSYAAALLAAGVGLAAADALLAGQLKRALLLVRPPGHHGLQNQAMGFCLFNNVAVCARHLRQNNVNRVAILDWDVHHGNGTEAIFYDDPHVLFISLHQYPHYPGTGAAEDTGVGPGAGFTLNLPMAAGVGDAEYRQAFEKQILPQLEAFAPEILLLSAGFDAHHKDPLGGINLNTKMYEWMTRQVVEFSEKNCKYGLISFLEGGYDLEALSDSVETHAAVLLSP